MKRRGFLLIELLIALCVAMSVISVIAVYHARTYTLYQDAQKRHKVLTAVGALIETMRHTHQIVAHSSIDPDSTITVVPVGPCLDNLTFLEINASWRLASGAVTTAQFTTCLTIYAMKE